MDNLLKFHIEWYKNAFQFGSCSKGWWVRLPLLIRRVYGVPSVVDKSRTFALKGVDYGAGCGGKVEVRI